MEGACSQHTLALLERCPDVAIGPEPTCWPVALGRKMAPKVAQVLVPNCECEPYMAKRTLQTWWKSLKWGSYPGLSAGFNVITKILSGKWEAGESVREEMWLMMGAEIRELDVCLEVLYCQLWRWRKEPWVKECRRPLAVGKAKCYVLNCARIPDEFIATSAWRCDRVWRFGLCSGSLITMRSGLPAVQGLRLWPSIAGGTGLISGWGTKILNIAWGGQKKRDHQGGPQSNMTHCLKED